MKKNVAKKEILHLLLQKYEISNELKRFIAAISENAEEVEDLTMVAFSLFAQTKKPGKNSVVITNLSSKLCLVKAVRDVLHLDLKRAKDLVDNMPIHDQNGRYYSVLPIAVGLGCPIGIHDWTEIANRLTGEMESILL